MVKIVQRLRRGYGKSRLSITTIVVSQWSRYLLCKLLKAGWSKYFISFFKAMRIKNIFEHKHKCHELMYPRMKMSAIYIHGCLKSNLLQMQDLTRLQKMHFFIGDTFFSKFVFCSYKSEINATLYNAISWYSLCLISFLFVSLAKTMKVIVLKI